VLCQVNWKVGPIKVICVLIMSLSQLESRIIVIKKSNTYERGGVGGRTCCGGGGDGGGFLRMLPGITVLGKKSGSGNALFPHPRRNQTKSRHCTLQGVTKVRNPRRKQDGGQNPYEDAGKRRALYSVFSCVQ